MQGTKREEHIFDKKRKQSVCEDKLNDIVPSKKKGKKDDPGSGLATEPCCNENDIFDILTSGSDVESDQASDLAIEPCSNKNDVQQDETTTTKHEELEKLSDVHSTKPTASAARGDSWKHKSSWLQLVGDATTSAFSLSQVLPGVACHNQESQQFNNIDFSNSRRGTQHNFVPTASGLNNSAPDGEHLNSYSDKKVEMMESSAPMFGTNLVPPSNGAMGDIVISETCPFMRTVASREEWSKSKATLSGSHMKKGKIKESIKN